MNAVTRVFLASTLLLFASVSSAGTRGVSSLSGVVGASLVEKTREIVDACGSVAISTFRRGARVAGSGRPSLHASGRAVDIQGNPRCIYAHLRGWAGGYSTDYARVGHVHVSLGGREDGTRFAHYRGGRAHRYARHHHRHYGRRAYARAL